MSRYKLTVPRNEIGTPALSPSTGEPDCGDLEAGASLSGALSDRPIVLVSLPRATSGSDYGHAAPAAVRQIFTTLTLGSARIALSSNKAGREPEWHRRSRLVLVGVI